ncbi:glycoside hydrolase family 13 protein, partial [Phlebopus sp. FC_14]
IQFFTWDAKHPDMSWWNHFEAEVPHLAALGFTQVWLPPPTKAMKKLGQGYDAYDLWDLGEFDQKGSVSTRWGTKEQLLRACSAARRRNIGVVIDAVLNHKLGADRWETFPAIPVDPKNRLRDIGQEREIKGATAFDFPRRQGKYSGMRWTQEHFTGLDWDDLTQTHAIYRITSPGHEGWSRRVVRELGNYDYLLGLDIDHRHPEVRRDLISWGSWILDETGASGFRLDATKHIDREFLLEFIKRSRNVANKDKLFAVSEFWSANVRLILPYIRAFEGQVSTAFFDVPLHDNFHRASKTGPSFDLRRIFENSLVKLRPGDAVTFVDSHEFQQVGQSLESWVNKTLKIQAYALILLRCGGFPCVFYGDLYPNEECFDQDTAMMLRQLVVVRKMFAYGPMKDYFKHKNCIGFVRMGNADFPGCAVVISNDSEAPAPEYVMTFMPQVSCHLMRILNSLAAPVIRMNVGPAGRGSAYRSFFDASRQVTINEDGWGEFSCPRGSVDVWVKSQQG